MDVFDLTRNLDQIRPAYAFDLAFLAIGVALTGAVLYRCYRRQWAALFYLPPALGWAVAAGWMTVHDIQQVRAVKMQIQHDRFPVVEGCLDQFHPGLASPNEADSGLERWTVAGQEFYYGADEVRLGYHKVEPGGGLVHADSWVRVGYVRDNARGHNDIVRLEVIQHKCPLAPDLG